MNQIEYIKNRINEYEGILDSIQKLGFADDLKEKELSVKKEIENLKYELAGLNEFELIKENIRKVNLNIVQTNNELENNKILLNNFLYKGNEIRNDIGKLNSVVTEKFQIIIQKIENCKHETKSLFTINKKNKKLEDKLDNLEAEISNIKKLLKENNKFAGNIDKNNEETDKSIKNNEINDFDEKVYKLAQDVEDLKESIEGFEGKLNKILMKLGVKSE